MGSYCYDVRRGDAMKENDILHERTNKKSKNLETIYGILLMISGTLILLLGFLTWKYNFFWFGIEVCFFIFVFGCFLIIRGMGKLIKQIFKRQREKYKDDPFYQS